MKLKRLFILLTNFIFLYSFNIELLSNSAIVIGENYYSENPFSGGSNKPRIRWIDWNNDGLDDLFLLDEDGRLKYFKNLNNFNFKLITTSFQSINCGGWFYFGDFDDDNQLELMTQSTVNPEHITYFENINGSLDIEVMELLSNVNEYILSEAVVTPTFADIDNDGDLDFFTGHVTGTLGFYENIGFQNNQPIFQFHTNDWQNILIIGQSSVYGRHGASAINFIDLDGDNDLDLTWGDYFQQSLYVVWNIGTPEEPQMENYNITNYFPSQPYTIESAGQNMPSFSDLDNDGDMDLFITVLGGAYGFQSVNNFYHFENVGDNEYPLYIEISRNFLNSLDFYDKVSPEFVDLDNDGDDDLIIGNSFETNSFPWNGRLKFLENRGSNLNPEYHIINEEFLGSLIGKDLTPTFIDIDNDGDLDIFTGETYGKIFYAENLGDINNWIYDEFSMFLDIDVGYNSVPVFNDIDNDGDYDLFIGNSDGLIVHYKNIGSNENYHYEFITENFSNINVESKSFPEFVDFDNDSDYDLLIGSEYNGILLYENIGDIELHNFIINEDFNFPDLGTNLKVSVNKVNQDINNIYVGNTLGGLLHLKFSICGNGDLNGDSILNISDIILMIDIILFGSSNQNSLCVGDSDLDGLITITDILEFLIYLLN